MGYRVFEREIRAAENRRPAYPEADVPESSWMAISQPRERQYHRMSSTYDGVSALAHLIPFTNGRNFYGGWWTYDFPQSLVISPVEFRRGQRFPARVFGTAMFTVFSYRDSWPLAAIVGQARTPDYQKDYFWRFLPRAILRNRERYSRTTSKHDHFTSMGLDRLQYMCRMYAPYTIPRVDIGLYALSNLMVMKCAGDGYFMNALDWVERKDERHRLCVGPVRYDTEFTSYNPLFGYDY
jgi:hypothetical protein